MKVLAPSTSCAYEFHSGPTAAAATRASEGGVVGSSVGSGVPESSCDDDGCRAAGGRGQGRRAEPDGDDTKADEYGLSSKFHEANFLLRFYQFGNV